jgi:hypothetical protein
LTLTENPSNGRKRGESKAHPPCHKTV